MKATKDLFPLASNTNSGTITIFYDGACPRCVKDRHLYEKMADMGNKQATKNEQNEQNAHNEQVAPADLVVWFDITDHEHDLRKLGIDPTLAMMELHIQTANGEIKSELSAYILLLERISWLKPLAWLISLPVIRSILAYCYHRSVLRRLRKSGRLASK